MRIRLLGLIGCAGLAAACGNDGSARIEVSLEYPTEGARTITGSLHLWVLRFTGEVEEGEVPPGCTALVAEENDPYDPGFERFSDDVFLLPDEPTPTAEGVPQTNLLVYVEAVDFGGDTHLAGCAAVAVDGDATVDIRLQAPGTYDCADPTTENGDPCDDGELCTVQEACSGGSCQGGIERDCTFIADDCNAAMCDETVGCVKQPLSGQSCSDNLFCSSGDTCVEGVCTGVPTDCSSLENGCRTGVCNETSNLCQPVNFPFGSPCDLFCRMGSTCNSTGTCNLATGTPRNCTAEVGDQCNTGSCDEENDECDPVPLTGNSCNDSNACTTGETCAAGACAGGVVTDQDNDGYSPIGCPPESIGTGDCNDGVQGINPGVLEGPPGDAKCTDTLDNDCDSLTDANDPDCQPPA